MEFEKPKDEDFKKFISLLNPTEFIQDMWQRGELEHTSKVYGENCYRLCNNAIAWCIEKLIDTPYIYQIKVVEGEFKGEDHTWFKVGEYYVDLTLAQFVDDAPEIAITKISKVSRLYNKSGEYDCHRWIKRQK